jgi:hypothetical protein
MTDGMKAILNFLPDVRGVHALDQECTEHLLAFAGHNWSGKDRGTSKHANIFVAQDR